ncbi:MAG: glycosyltransferase family 4 protein [Chloroflexi bacterium]|nr:glycosyltransferase family 4 protein [Chloroflexota bacterium]
MIGYAAGIARYARELAAALARLDGNEPYVLLRSRRRAAIATPDPDMRQWFCLTPPHNRLERWTLPLELLARRPQPRLLHSLDHVAPSFGPWRSVVTIHDLAFLLYPATHTDASRAYYARSGESARRAERVIAVSQQTAADTVRLLGVDPARLRVIHQAPSASYSPRPVEQLPLVGRRLGFDPARPYLLMVGTLEPRKNVALALEALALLRHHVDAHLFVAGARGWLDEALWQAHERSGLGAAVHFLGPVCDDDLAVLYSHAAVFLFPSLYEGFGLPPLEAMACGTPVISSNAGPMPEVLGDAALLLPPREPPAWAHAIERVLGDSTLAAHLRARGLVRAESFSWQRTAQATRAVYREALLA